MISQLARKPLVWALAAIVGAYLAFGVFGVQALFINTTVDEAAPVALARATSAPLPSRTPASRAAASTPVPATVAPPTAPPTQELTATPAPKATAVPAPPTAVPAPPTAVPAPPTAVPAPPTAVPAPPTAVPAPEGPVVIATGQFHNVTHVGTGSVIVFRNPDGSHGLRFENLDVENGPDLFVYAVAAADAHDDGSVLNAGFVNVGKLKGNRGNQNYALPAGFNPAVHRSISIWCQRFSVNFVTAPIR